MDRMHQRLNKPQIIKPTNNKKKRELIDVIFDEEENERKRQALVHEATHESYFRDLREVSTKGAKLWIAPNKLRAGIHSQPIPDLHSKLLSDRLRITSKNTSILEYTCRSKATLVCFFFNAFGEMHIKTFLEPFIKRYSGNTNVEVLMVCVEEKWVRMPFLWLFTPYAKYKVPQELHDKYMMYYGDIREKRTVCGMNNNIIGWVNLVDSKGRIRWQAHGPAQVSELEAMFNLTEVLLKN